MKDLQHKVSAPYSMKNALFVLVAVALASCNRAPQGPPQTLGGLVKDVAGKPAAGALVRVSSAEPGRVVLVVSQQDGTFHTPKLPAGNYTAQGFLGDYKSASSAPTVVSAGQAADVNLALSEARPQLPPEKLLT